MNNLRFLRFSVLLLLLLNVSVLGFVWFGFAGHPRNNTARFLERELQLTPAQKDSYTQMHRAHHEATMQGREVDKATLHELYTLLAAAPADTAANRRIDACLDSLAAHRRRVERITFEHFREVRGLCTPAQQKRFDEVIEEAMMMLKPKK